MKPPKPPPGPDRRIKQPTVYDSRGTLIKIRTDKTDKDKKAELWEVAQDLGWPEDVGIRTSFSRRRRARRADGWTISDKKGARKDIRATGGFSGKSR